MPAIPVNTPTPPAGSAGQVQLYAAGLFGVGAAPMTIDLTTGMATFAEGAIFNGTLAGVTALQDLATGTQMFAVSLSGGNDTVATFTSKHGNTGYLFVRDVAGGRMSLSGSNGVAVEPYGGGAILMAVETAGATTGLTRLGTSGNVLIGNFGTNVGIAPLQVMTPGILATGKGPGILWSYDSTSNYRSSIDLSFDGSVVANNYLAFMVCNGTATNKVNVLQLAGDKSATFNGAVSGITTLALSGNLSMASSGTTNTMLDFGANFNSTAIQLYNGGAGHSYGWGLTAGTMEFFVDPAAVYAFRFGGTFGSGTAAFQVSASTITHNVGSAFAAALSLNNNVNINLAGNAGSTATHFYKDNNNHTQLYSDFYANDIQIDFATVKINTNSLGATTFGGTVAATSVAASARFTNTTIPAVSSSGTIGTDASATNIFQVTLTGSVTLGNPTNGVDGQRVTWRLIQDGTGGRVLSLDTKFKLGGDITSVTLSTAAGAVDYLTAIYNSTADKWHVVSFIRGF